MWQPARCRFDIPNRVLFVPESLREYFSKYGDISEVMVMKDPATRRSSGSVCFAAGAQDSGPLVYTPRGFGFITFTDPSSVDKVLAQGTHELDGKKVSGDEAAAEAAAPPSDPPRPTYWVPVIPVVWVKPPHLAASPSPPGHLSSY
ncbi:hypothetical protein HUJ04_000041 [Dendroctonus ponderosae]|nr:hypothetical protein HUJ04_000041 [Dendroctonus ponderosae]